MDAGGKSTNPGIPTQRSGIPSPHVEPPPAGYEDMHREVFTPGALAFLVELCSHFNTEVEEVSDILKTCKAMSKSQFYITVHSVTLIK